MARGQRKSTLEKLQEELTGVQENIMTYERALVTLKSRAKELTSQIQIEELKELQNLLVEKNMTIDALKELINNGMEETEAQGA